MPDRLVSGVADARDAEDEAYRTRRLSEFVYGVVSAMIAVAGLTDNTDPMTGIAAALAVVAGAAAIWLAHSYADWLGERVREKHKLSLGELARVLATAWPIVIAGVVVSLPVAVSESPLWSMQTGLLLANLTGLAILAIIGFYAGRLARMGLVRRFALAGVTVGLGVAVILIEQAAHHLI